MKMPHLQAKIESVESAVKKWRSERGMDVDSSESKSSRVADVAIISMPMHSFAVPDSQFFSQMQLETVNQSKLFW